jgi:hypothetical protein
MKYKEYQYIKRGTRLKRGDVGLFYYAGHAFHVDELS